VVQSLGLWRMFCEVRSFRGGIIAYTSQVPVNWRDIRLEYTPPDLLTSVQVLCLPLPLHLHLLSNRLGPSATNGQNIPLKTILDTHRLKAWSNFPKSIFLEIEELRGRWAEEEGTGSATSASSSSTVWEIGWYSERLGIFKEVEWSRS
jgi:hypothetical protein